MLEVVVTQSMLEVVVAQSMLEVVVKQYFKLIIHVHVLVIYPEQCKIHIYFNQKI
jgi:hypothetical protein